MSWQSTAWRFQWSIASHGIESVDSFSPFRRRRSNWALDSGDTFPLEKVVNGVELPLSW